VTSKRLNLSVQYAQPPDGLPQRAQVRRWARAALDVDGARGGQITVRFVDADEGRALNRDYRHKDYATNVLSFTYAGAPVVCGDLVVCAPVVAREAAAQGKSPLAHYAHLIVHGVLHLQGYDHEAGKKQARLMEGHERAILAELGYADPYLETRE
jgi:probable rRNA maturation factor